MLIRILIGTIIFGFIVYAFYLSIQRKKTEDLRMIVIAKLNTYGKVFEENRKQFFQTQKETYQLLFFNIAANSELTINSRTIWEIRDASKPHLVDQTAFLSSLSPKLVILYPISTKIKRYINENEMVFIKPSDRFYEMHVVKHFELDALLKENIL